MADQQGPSVLDVAKLGKLGFEYLAPETYANLTSSLPSWTSLLGGGEAAAGGMSALGGLGMASMYAAPAMILALLGSMYGDTGDTAITYGAGMGDLSDGTFTPQMGPKLEEASNLFSDFVGDGKWHQGGDTQLVSDKPINIGSMSIANDQPYSSIGGVPYRTDELAIASGRQISRGEMGMPVEYEDLYNYYAPGGPAPELMDMLRNSAVPVYDAPANLPENWDYMLDLRNQRSDHGEGQSSGNQTYDIWYAGLNPRQREWADMGLNTGQLYAYTGAETSPDAQPIAKNESPMPGTVAETPTPVAPVDDTQAKLDANAKATAALPPKFTKDQMQQWLTYGQGPEAMLGRPLDLASIIGS